ncbi:hypothetical protein AB834_07160 [PVC group bacterium (ex Bugula neritina AB1)]|nr:hypothetical protein AB834_07160 [PVC group bacterium (ex Bugula neritina AB1)]
MSAFFEYKAIDNEGNFHEGILEAPHKNAAIETLHENKWIPVEVKQKKEKTSFSFSASASKKISLNSKRLLSFTSSCANLLEAGFPIDQAILTLGQTSKKSSPLKNVCEAILQSLQEGQSLSQSLKSSSASFRPFYVGLIKSGEEIGNLPYIFKRLHIFLSEQAHLKKTIQGILIYPVILTLTCVSSIAIILGFVIPRFVTIFEDLGQDLPFITKVIVQLSDLFRHYFLALISSFFIAFVLFIILKNNRKVKPLLHHFSLKLPYIGPIQKKIANARFCSTLGILTEGGLSIIPALSCTQEIIFNLYMKNAIKNIKEGLQKGVAMHLTMKKYPLVFPDLMVQMLAIGDKTGSLTHSLKNISSIYENDTRSILKAITTLLSPILILSMGLIVGIIIMSVLLPLLNATHMIS